MPCSCCCADCTSPCCDEENPTTGGVCCDGVWYTGAGTCCDGVWQTGAGTCCDDVWQTGAGVCCGGVWQTGSGECCGGVWRTDAGDCCYGVWYPDADPGCPEGETYTRWGPNDVCCGCLPDPEDPPAYCPSDGPPKACCSEDTDGLVTCAVIGELLCDPPSVLADPDDCSTGCLGACCVDGEYQGQTTQAACDGCWAGVGTTECLTGCREPFTSACCESAQSSAALLTFTQPRFKRCPPFAETFRVTVTGHTDSPILIHGTPFGARGKRCPINHSFLLCWDKFNIEPVPCGTDFIDLDVTVCWEEEATDTETLNFSGCDGLTVWLGACDYGCVTTLVYSGAGHVSDVTVELHGDGVIEANGSGALEITGNVTCSGSCINTLTLKGTSTADNEISGVIQDSSSGLAVRKEGAGLWRLSGVNTFSEPLAILSGTIVAAITATDVVSNGSVFGSGLSDPVVGDSAKNSKGVATLLTERDLAIDRSVTVAALGSGGSQEAILGMASTSGTAVLGGDDNTSKGKKISLGRDVTLQAADGGTLMFKGTFTGLGGVGTPQVAINVGSAGNDGTVVMEQSLFPDSITAVNIRCGTLQLNVIDPIDNPGLIGIATPVTLGGALGGGTLDINGVNQPLASVEFDGTESAVVGSGTLRLDDGPEVFVSGTDHEISCSLVLDDDATFDGDGELLISGVVSGNGGITKDGNGSITLSGSNTYTGTTTINDGSMKAGSLAAFGTGGIVVNAGGTLDKNGYNLANTITNNGGTVIS